MLTCRELVEVVTDYLEGALPADRHAEVLAHLEGCDDCLRYLVQFEATRQALASVPSVPFSAEQRSAALDAFRAWCEAGHGAVVVRRPWWRRWRRLAGPR